MKLHSKIQVTIRVALAAASLGILGTVVALTTVFRFDVVTNVLFRGVQWVKGDSDNIDSVPELPPSWIPFLGGEFTMTVLLPLGVYGLWLSKLTLVSTPDLSNPLLLLPVGMLVAILTGLLSAHGVLFRYCVFHLSSDETDKKLMERSVVISNTRWILLLLGVVLIRVVTILESLFEKRTTPAATLESSN
jgi:hypothetical protein